MPVVPLNTPAAPDPKQSPVAGQRPVADLELIVPAYNEEGRLGPTIDALTTELDNLDGLRTQLVVVDNGSSDRTADVVDRYVRHLDADPADPSTTSVEVIGCSEAGKGAAVRRGVLTSTAQYVGFFDADLATPTASLPQAVDLLLDGEHVVIGSRRCEGAEFVVSQPPARRAAGWMFRQAIRGLVPDVRDTQCGFKLFSRQAAVRLFEGLNTAGFTFDVELLMRAAAWGYPVREVPVGYSHDEKSSLHLATDAPRILGELVRLRRAGRAALRRDPQRDAR